MTRARTLTALCLAGGFFGIAAGTIACGDGDAPAGTGAPGEAVPPPGTPTSGSPGAVGANPVGAVGMVAQLDLLELAHLADVDHHGLYIDFGTPTRDKYTLGDWYRVGGRTGWGSDGADGDETFTYAGRNGRIYVDLREAGPVTLRCRLRAIGSRRLQLYVNGRSLPEGFELGEGDAFQEVDLPVPADFVRVGENMFQLTFGGTEVVDGENVSVAVSSIRVIPGAAPAADASFVAPDWGTYVSDGVEIGGISRRSLAVHAPTTVTYYAEVPAGGRLVFGVGAEGDTTATARVAIQAEGGEAREVWTGTAGSTWSDQSIDLADWAGQVVRIDLSAEGGGTGRVAWSVPAVMVPAPPSPPETPEVRNVVVVLVDTLRASKLRPYNPSSRVRTPIFDGLAESGTLFTMAQSQENWTKPSVASVLTGLSPPTHHATTDAARVSDAAELVSEAFDGAGFATGSFIANGYVSDRFGFDQGWDSYSNYIREGGSTEGEDVYRLAGDFIEAHRDERFFVYIQTIDPHVPYDPPAEYLTMYDDRTDYTGIVAPRRTHELLEGAKRNPPTVTFTPSDVRRLEGLHDGEITYTDHWMGEFLARLEQLGVADDTLVVVTSDHGEEFDDHGSWGHGHTVYQELLAVPLLFHGPGVPSGVRVDHPTTTMNVAQTVLDLADVEGLSRAEGHSLVAEMSGALPPYPMVAFSHMMDDRRVVRASRWKMIMNGANTKLFDLGSDPGEEIEITDMTRHPIAARYLRILLGAYLGAEDRGHWWEADQTAHADVTATDATMDRETCEQLRALGYVPNCDGL